MEVTKTFERPDGTVKFEADLTADEVQAILSIGLNYLIESGAAPFTIVGDKLTIYRPDEEEFQ